MPVVAKVVKQLYEGYGIRRFIAMLSQDSVPSNLGLSHNLAFYSDRIHLSIAFFHLRHGLQCGLFSAELQTKI
jgi:hypothetical protein